MPYVNIKITREGVTPEQKAALIKATTDLLVDVLDKDPATTSVVINEVDLEDWSVGGMPVEQYRRALGKGRSGRSADHAHVTKV
ncbi:tautomerase family protein [Aminobacter carboxidus]|uniref:Tautomerase n=1 Tax=Aminobacter carboxidus TaxID=376165 RepID=A0ABR9GRR9_9HYPH|nr:4-oxalocrotonate tautomerase family protein [Aminobacter carboxidus]MBE1206382.1 4-oxalocrotonate tautomerase family protein [Aminobacter carboxidus]